MKKTLLIASVVSLAGSFASYGATATYSTLETLTGSFANTTVVDSSGSLIANGTGYAAIGTFSLDDAAIAGASGAALAAAFTEYASTTFGGDNSGNADGIANGGGTRLVDGTFANQTIYFVFGNDADLASSAEYAVVNTGQSFIAAQDPNVPDTATFDIDISGVEAGQVIAGSLIAGVSSPVLAGFGAPDAGGTIQLVPEASTALLSLLGLGLIFRRRR